MINKLTAIVIWRGSSVSSKYGSKFLKKICGKTIIQIMDERLKQFNIKNIILITKEEDFKALIYTKKIGWKVINYYYRKFSDIRVALSLMSSKYIAIFDLNYPFVDSDLFERMFTEMRNHNLKYINLTKNRSYGPEFITTKDILIKCLIYKIFTKNRSLLLKDIFYEIIKTSSKKKEYKYPNNILNIEITANSASEFFIQSLGGTNFSLKKLSSIYSDPNKLRKILCQEMFQSETPHLINAQLNQLEQSLKVDDLFSFPVELWLNTTSICNARCSFCGYSPVTQKNRDILTLEDLKKMTWLKYVSKLNLLAGIGDVFTNPQFLDCYFYIKEAFPHLDVIITSNGIKLNEEYCEAFVGHLSQLNISLNAATKETWEKLIRVKGFDHIIKMYSFLYKLKKDKKVSLPKLSLSMVLCKENVHEMVKFVELADKLGAEKVDFRHYLPATLVGKRDMEKSNSLYYEKDQYDEMLRKAIAKAEELEIQIIAPLPFAYKGCYINMGERSIKKPSLCIEPWRNCCLTVDEDGNRQLTFCCSSFYLEINYNKSELTEFYFHKKIWNHPISKYFRKSVNIKGKNPICDFCNYYDQYDPENDLIYEIHKKVCHIFKDVNEKTKLKILEERLENVSEEVGCSPANVI